MAQKNDKLKKLEIELKDLKQWHELGLVPKKDETKHLEEIHSLTNKIKEEKDKLKFLKEHGDLEEYVAPKRQTGKNVYQEMPTIPDVEFGNAEPTEEYEANSATEAPTEEETSSTEEVTEGEEPTVSNEDEESYFSDKARWKRGGIIDPEDDTW